MCIYTYAFINTFERYAINTSYIYSMIKKYVMC